MTALTKGYAIQKADVKSLDYRLAEDINYEDGHQKSSGYVSTTSLRVRVRDLGTYRAIIVSLLDSGVNSIESISFGVEDPEALREKALVAAYADAERMAKSLAAVAKAGLGPGARPPRGRRPKAGGANAREGQPAGRRGVERSRGYLERLPGLRGRGLRGIRAPIGKGDTLY